MIVSLTTYSKRANTVHKTIISLLNQTATIDKIILWLDKDEFTLKTLPKDLAELQGEVFNIEFCENTKSFKKLIPTLEKYPEANIVTVDDDFIYPSTLIESLLEYNAKFPGCVIGARGRVMRVEYGEIKPYPDWQFVQLQHGIKSSHALIPIGYAGILYPVNSLHRDVFKKDLYTKLCPTADDLWFKAMAMLQGTATVIMPLEKTNGMKPIEGTQDEALYLTHNAGDANTNQMKAIVSHYPKLKKCFKDDLFSECSIDGYSFVKEINAQKRQQSHSKIEAGVSQAVNEIRESAILLEKKNLRLAFSLMKVAALIRPNGPLINKKLSEYKAKLMK